MQTHINGSPGYLPERQQGPGWTEAQARDVAKSFDPRALPQDFTSNPYPYYAALLSHAPMHHCPDGTWFASSYKDLNTIYRDTTRYSSDKKKEFLPKYGNSPLYEHHTTSLVFNDPPLHTRVRGLIVGALTPRIIANMQPGLITLVDSLLDRMADLETPDLIDDFASAIPIEIIGNLLGVPHEDRDPLRGWSLAILSALEPVITPEQEETGNRSVLEMLDYLRDLVAERTKHPRDPAVDVLTRLIQGEKDGGRLTETELLQNCIFILNAGHETTTNLIGNGIFSLMEWPEERARLLAEPDLIGTAVEEFLRFESSNQLGNRITTQEVEIGGHVLPKATQITLCIGAANRDPAQFPDPDRLDISRKPNKHLAFGGGPHTCAGLSLARLEGKIAISRFLTRYPDYALAGDPVRGGRVRFRGFAQVPLNLR